MTDNRWKQGDSALFEKEEVQVLSVSGDQALIDLGERTKQVPLADLFHRHDPYIGFRPVALEVMVEVADWCGGSRQIARAGELQWGMSAPNVMPIEWWREATTRPFKDQKR